MIIHVTFFLRFHGLLFELAAQSGGNLYQNMIVVGRDDEGSQPKKLGDDIMA